MLFTVVTYLGTASTAGSTYGAGLGPQCVQSTEGSPFTERLV
jgi:hypothetical protein